jgi:hypothetical protein
MPKVAPENPELTGLVDGSYRHNSFLLFETEKKAELFLKEKIDLITDLSKAGII